jgi:toxin ParE1/3/4
MVLNHTIQREAEEEIQEALDHYNHINIELAQSLLGIIGKSIAEIKKNPFLFQKINKRFRKANIERFPFQIIFKVENNELLIFAFAHHKRKPNYWKKRKAGI